ncbi:MAG: CYTH domain-containing protein [Candidatus Diapherotrites archaeon]|uniref:CYTH domain-containing protein n=1 Tax=Candidatus Iainarchaeum sp. TaxID=3101447 RepID=A0A8T5GEK8_9ARCH|nr:CYTH domain-containing protein [Candidatus Diapherotrites archaeon]
MGTEFETEVLEVNVDEIVQKLRELGAKEIPEVLQQRWVFSLACSGEGDFGKGKDAWIRLRKVGERTELTYKNKVGKEKDGTEEIEVEVSDFEKTHDLLSKLSCFEGKYYQENKRHKFVLNDIEFTLDTWPKIPTILEIESTSEEKVNQGLKLLDLVGKDTGHLGLVKIYFKYGIDLHSFKELKFC